MEWSIGYVPTTIDYALGGSCDKMLLRRFLRMPLMGVLRRVLRMCLAFVSVGLLGAREQGNLRECSPSALESALRNWPNGCSRECSMRVLSRVLSLHRTTGRAPLRALSGALPRAPRVHAKGVVLCERACFCLQSAS